MLVLDAPLVDENFIKELNMNYARALLYEFSLSNRDAVFINNVIQVKFFFILIFYCLKFKKLDFGRETLKYNKISFLFCIFN